MEHIIRINTKRKLRNDDDYFISPGMLPEKHPIVIALIEYCEGETIIKIRVADLFDGDV